jgi:hypothetical protein
VEAIVKLLIKADVGSERKLGEQTVRRQEDVKKLFDDS